MLGNWKKKGSGAPWLRETSHGTWLISTGSEIGNELRYAARDAAGRLPTVPLAIGDFGSAYEAMIAVDLYEGDASSNLAEDYVQALLPDPDAELVVHAPGNLRFVLRRSPAGVYLGLGRTPASVAVLAILRAPSIEGSGGITHARPPGHDDPVETDIRIMAQLFEVRRARRSGSANVPLGQDEYVRWAEVNAASHHSGITSAR